MDKHELMERTRQFAIRVYKLINRFPKLHGANVISYQLLKTSSSEAANYRAAYRGKSRADFINKMKIVEEEADELVAIFTQSLKTLKL
jgi:four helix bundle protein